MDNYIVSARKYRPATFDTVVGQRALTTTLKNAVLSGKLAHAYLFCGPRGVGKTTCARIFAKTINCLNPTAEGEACNECESCLSFNEGRSLNVRELDAASNNSVDDIRQLVEQVRIPPQVGRYRVYIIDEVHMLSTSAFNAFLKTLEEPPRHAIFILATTEKHKILPTILSRCQIYDFSRIGVDDIVAHLAYVASKEGISAEPEALNVIALKADGGMRDALSVFDQVVSFTGGHITYKGVLENLNVLDYEYYFRMVDYFLEGNVGGALVLFGEVLGKGFDGSHFVTGLAQHLRDVLVSKDAVTLPLLEVGASIRERYGEQAWRCPVAFLYQALKLANDCDLHYRASKNKRLLVELMLIQAAQLTAPAAPGGEGGGGQPIKPLKAVQPAAQPSPAPVPARPQATPPPAQAAAKPVEMQAATEPNGQQQAAQSVASASVSLQARLKQEEQRKTPNVARSGLGISIRHPRPEAGTGSAEAAPSVAPVVRQEPEEDYLVTERDVNFYWLEFAGKLPHEQVAMTRRMQNMQAKLLADGVTFEVVVDNEIVAKEFTALAPEVEDYLRTRLKNRRLKMAVRVSAPAEKVRAVSRVEKFQLMAEKNPALYRLKESFGLEFS